MTGTKTLSASLEDYLEAIFNIIAEKKAARPKEISRLLKVRSSSVTGALKSLSEKELINYSPYDLVTLTPKGDRIAKDVVRRHEILRDFLVNVLAVDATEAEQAACSMEHSISRDVLERLVRFAEFVETCPRAGQPLIEGFESHCEEKSTKKDCFQCVNSVLEQLEKTKAGQGRKSTIITLKDLVTGQKGKIVKVKAKGEIRKRIIEMGITTGALAKVERVAPLGDPIELKIRGYHISLRRSEAESIEVEPI